MYIDDIYIWATMRKQRKKQIDRLATNVDDITTQSHSLFACSREKKSPGGEQASVHSTRSSGYEIAVNCDLFLHISGQWWALVIKQLLNEVE